MKCHRSLVILRKTSCTLASTRAVCPAPCPPPRSRPDTQRSRAYIPQFGGRPWVTALGNQTLAELRWAKLRVAMRNRDLQRCPRAPLEPSCSAGSCRRPCPGWQPHGTRGAHPGLPHISHSLVSLTRRIRNKGLYPSDPSPVLPKDGEKQGFRAETGALLPLEGRGER